MKTLILLLYWPLVATLTALLSVWLFRRGVRRGWIYLVQGLCATVALFCLSPVVEHLHVYDSVVLADFLNLEGWRIVLFLVLLWMISVGLFFFLLAKLAPGLWSVKVKKTVPPSAE
jgi:MFS family permease